MQTYKEELQLSLKQNLPWQRLSGKTILLSGVTGMIGKCLVDLLMQCNEDMLLNYPVNVIALSRNEDSAMQRLASIGIKMRFNIFPATSTRLFRNADVPTM